jgi:hypothetical protein
VAKKVRAWLIFWTNRRNIVAAHGHAAGKTPAKQALARSPGIRGRDGCFSALWMEAGLAFSLVPMRDTDNRQRNARGD